MNSTLKSKILRLIRVFWIKHDNLWKDEVEKEKKFLASFPEPQNLIERSYFQYLCQCQYYKGFRLTIWEIITFFSFFPMLLFLLLRPNSFSEDKSEGIFLGRLALNYTKDSIKDECSQWTQLDVLGNMTLSLADLVFFFKHLGHYFYRPLFMFKCLLKLARYSWLIGQYEPKYILVEESSSYAASFMTLYCHHRNIKHYFSAHGDLFFCLRDTFVVFDRYYIWEEYYVKFFKSMRVPRDADFVLVSPVDKTLREQVKQTKKIYDFTYYMQAEDKKSLRTKHAYLSKLRNKGMTISVRPHPLHTNIDDFNEVFFDFDKENVTEISLTDSLKRTKCVISEYSTVLYQAYLLGLNVVIDDFYAPEKIKVLKKREYIMFEKNHQYFSALLAR